MAEKGTKRRSQDVLQKNAQVNGQRIAPARARRLVEGHIVVWRRMLEWAAREQVIGSYFRKTRLSSARQPVSWLDARGTPRARANFCALTGLPNKNPCAWSKPISWTARKSARVSMPLATVRAP